MKDMASDYPLPDVAARGFAERREFRFGEAARNMDVKARNLIVDPDRIEALRAAFAATMEDPDFLAEAEASNLLIEPLDGAQTTALVEELYAMPEEVVTRVRELLVEQ